jgi:hypothetical protein
MIPAEFYHTYQIGYRPFEQNDNMNFDNLTHIFSNSFNQVYKNTMRFYNQTDTYLHDTFQEIRESQNISKFFAVIYGFMLYLAITNIWLLCRINNEEFDDEIDEEIDEEFELDDNNNTNYSRYQYFSDEEYESEIDSESQYNEINDDIDNKINELILKCDFVMYNPPFEQKSDSELTELEKLQNIQKAQARIICEKEEENQELIKQIIKLDTDNDNLMNEKNRIESISNARVKVLQDERKQREELRTLVNKQTKEIENLKTQLNLSDTKNSFYNLTNETNENKDNIINYSFSSDCLDNKTLTKKKNIDIQQLQGRKIKPLIKYYLNKKNGTINVSYTDNNNFDILSTVEYKISSINYLMNNVFAKKLYDILKLNYTYRQIKKLNNNFNKSNMNIILEYYMMIEYNNYSNKNLSDEDLYIWSYIYRIIHDFNVLNNKQFNKQRALDYFTSDKIIHGDKYLFTKYQVAVKNNRLVEDNYNHLYHLWLAKI